MNKVEQWKQEKHGFDVWPDLLDFAQQQKPMKQIDHADLERMKWHGVFYRKRDAPESYMLRIRLTGCELTDQQAKEIAYVAYELGYGIVDVTTRASVQIQGLSLHDAPKALARLERVGLSAKQTGHDNVRNVFCHPLSGIDAEELIDTRPFCRDISALFLGNREYSDLPRKFNIAVCGRESPGVHYWTQDLSYLATRTPGGEIMFQVLLGGSQGQNPRLPWRLPALVAPSQIVDVTEAVLDLFREQGSREKRDRARFRYLIEKIGVDGVLEFVERRLDRPLLSHSTPSDPPCGNEEFVGWFRQHDAKLWAMGLCVPLGRLTWRQMEGLGRLAKKWGDGSLRTTPDQGIVVPNIPMGFKDAAATEAAGLGLSPHADTLLRNTVACTGKQFCNIAVTETKGQMLRLIEKLRQRALMLHGIRIHMSGCPSSCAQHLTADIGLKGVRVRRLLGTREGFDVFLAGGISGQVHLGLPYRLGVDADQLPQLIEEVVGTYYLKHKPGQTFSAYWREKLREKEAAKVDDAAYTPPTWLCEGCGHRHLGEDPPVYCPVCAGLRRLFARLEDDQQENSQTAENNEPNQPPKRVDGFVFAANDSALGESEGLEVEIDGMDFALFRVDGKVVAMDGACPHEGAPLAQGVVDSGVVTCPWHGWTFDTCTGCSVDPPGQDVRRYDAKVEDGKIFVKVEDSSTSHREAKPPATKRRRTAQPVTAKLSVVNVFDETHDIKTFRLDNSAGQIPKHLPGQFARVRLDVDGQEHWRSFTISASPARSEYVDLTIKRNPRGIVSNFLHDVIEPGASLTIASPHGGFFFDEDEHTEPLVLLSAGSGITPMMSILRHIADRQLKLPCAFVHGARTADDIAFRSECQQLAREMANVIYTVCLTQPPQGWPGPTGRIDAQLVARHVQDLTKSRFFLCGPGEFIESLRAGLSLANVPSKQIHSEEFGAALPVAAAT